MNETTYLKGTIMLRDICIIIFILFEKEYLLLILWIVPILANIISLINDLIHEK